MKIREQRVKIKTEIISDDEADPQQDYDDANDDEDEEVYNDANDDDYVPDGKYLPLYLCIWHVCIRKGKEEIGPKLFKWFY